ncbi:MAG: hypothetical protein ABR498_04515 [Candidatus Dormibacteria bacterium]
MRIVLQLTAGALVCGGLTIATVWLWTHNLIIFAAPVAFAAAGAAWVAVDNTLIYPRQRARRAGTDTDDNAGPGDVSEISARG